MRTLLYLIEKEFKQIRRDSFMPKIIFIVPALQLLILPFAANFEMRNINISIVDRDHSTISQQLVNKVLSSGYFKLADVSKSYDESLKSIEVNKSDIMLEIPNGFERSLMSEPMQLFIAANAVNGTKGGLGSAYLSNIAQEFLIYISGENMRYMSISSDNYLTYSYLYNPHLNYKNFMIPGIIAFLISMIGGALSALNIVREKENGTIEQINVTPVPKAIFILSKLIPFWVIGFILLTIGTFTAWIIYGLTPVGNMAIIYLFTAVFMISFTGFGLAISNISSTQTQAMFTAFFFLIVFALMSGQFTPISSMPDWAQKITIFNPLRYFIEIMRMVYLKGSHFSDVKNHFAITCLFAVAFNVLAIIGYKKVEN
jgi:ABC-2 type transport system permease protein